MNYDRLCGLTRKAIDKYNMISENDMVAIGISGGKDSIALLYSMAKLKEYYPLKFDLIGLTVDNGFNGFDSEVINDICSSLNVKYDVIHTHISEIVFDLKKEKNPCSLCSKMRKGAITDYLKQNNINKIAYAHHKDDVVETLFMSMLYEGQISTFEPVTYYKDNDITVIRPLIYINEADIIGFKNKMNYPIIGKICPADGKSKREYIKNLLNDINRDNPGAKERLFNSVIKGNSIEGW